MLSPDGLKKLASTMPVSSDGNPPNHIDVTRGSHGCNNYIKDTSTSPKITSKTTLSQQAAARNVG